MAAYPVCQQRASELSLPSFHSARLSFELLRTITILHVTLTYLLPTAIKDPNTGITLWESGAIVSYLIDTYDKEHKLAYTTTPEKYLLEQWSYFQASGQGPYFGQCAWYAPSPPLPRPHQTPNHPT